MRSEGFFRKETPRMPGADPVLPSVPYQIPLGIIRHGIEEGRWQHHHRLDRPISFFLRRASIAALVVDVLGDARRPTVNSSWRGHPLHDGDREQPWTSLDDRCRRASGLHWKIVDARTMGTDREMGNCFIKNLARPFSKPPTSINYATYYCGVLR